MAWIPWLLVRPGPTWPPRLSFCLEPNLCAEGELGREMGGGGFQPSKTAFHSPRLPLMGKQFPQECNGATMLRSHVVGQWQHQVASTALGEVPHQEFYLQREEGRMCRRICPPPLEFCTVGLRVRDLPNTQFTSISQEVRRATKPDTCPPLSLAEMNAELPRPCGSLSQLTSSLHFA